MKPFEKSKYTTWYITEDGTVYSKSTYGTRMGELRTVRPNKNKRGYLYVRTTSKNYQIHRLVAVAFIPNTENKPCVNHKDSNRHNNRKENLEWVTHKENTQHGLKHGNVTMFKKNEGGALKYTEQQCKDVIERVKNGMTYVQAGKVHNMPYSTVAHLIRGSRREIKIA